MTWNIAVLPGDGIGPEVTTQALRVLRAAAERHGIELTISEALVGGAAIDAVGEPLPEATLTLCKRSDAVLLGAVGGPKWDGLPGHLRPERALLGLRKELGLFANLRPVTVHPALMAASTLKPEALRGVDLVVVRELIGGLYFGEPAGIEMRDGEEVGFNTAIYSTSEVTRIARVAFDLARLRRKKVTSVDKANVLAVSQLWRKVVTAVHAAEYADVELEHLYVDNAAMQLIRRPADFDVIVTGNLFGDILSDEAAMLTGSIGMLPSASLGGSVALYEPIHGSAPDIAGLGLANPLATIASVAMLLRHSLRAEAAASSVERAISAVLDAGYRTGDLLIGADPAGAGARLSTSEMGSRVIEQLAADPDPATAPTDPIHASVV